MKSWNRETTSYSFVDEFALGKCWSKPCLPIIPCLGCSLTISACWLRCRVTLQTQSSSNVCLGLVFLLHPPSGWLGCPALPLSPGCGIARPEEAGSSSSESFLTAFAWGVFPLINALFVLPELARGLRSQALI